MAMRKTVAALISLAAISGLARTSSATVIAHDDFNYMGDINGEDGGVGFSGAYSSAQFGSANATQPGLGGSPSKIDLQYANDQTQEEENVSYNRSLDTSTDSGTVYVSFKINPVTFNGDDAGIQLAGLGLGHNDGNTLGIVNAQGGITATAGQTYNVVYEIDFDTDKAYFFNNPAPGAALDLAAADGSYSGALDTLDSINLRQQELFAQYSSGTGETQYSDFTIGTTYADVAFPAATGGTGVPEPTSLSLIAVGGMGLLARRRRQV